MGLDIGMGFSIGAVLGHGSVELEGGCFLGCFLEFRRPIHKSLLSPIYPFLSRPPPPFPFT